MLVPLKQGLKHVFLISLHEGKLCLNVSSTKTRIETLIKEGELTNMVGLNVSSTKTRIETREDITNINNVSIV